MAGKIRIKKIRFIARSFSQRAELCYVSLLVHPNPVRFAVSTEIQETYFNRQHRHTPHAEFERKRLELLAATAESTAYEVIEKPGFRGFALDDVRRVAKAFVLVPAEEPEANDDFDEV